uniref:Uncharacterized protein n=1 Tax=Opuntia streptacantha TaxID=393608 RepID=A0A7C9AKL6_OPUST
MTIRLSTRKSESTDILLSLVMLCSSARRNFPLSSSSLCTRFFHSTAIFSACASLAKISSFSFFDASTCRFESFQTLLCFYFSIVLPKSSLKIQKFSVLSINGAHKACELFLQVVYYFPGFL